MKKQRMNKVQMCRKHCKNHSPKHIIQEPTATRKTKPNRKITQKGLEKQCQKNKKKRIHFGADFDSKIMDFRQFSTSGTPRSVPNVAPDALVKNASILDGFWDAFFRISMDLGSQMGAILASKMGPGEVPLPTSI